MGPSEGSWQEYEWLVTLMFAENCRTHINQKIPGKISGRIRKVEIVVWLKDGKFIIVDCKKRSSPVDINDVEQFIGMVEDTGAKQGILISSKGFTEGAKSRAKPHRNITLKHLDWEDLYEVGMEEMPLGSISHYCENCEDGMNRVMLNRILWYGAFGKCHQGTKEYHEGVVSVFMPGICVRCECIQLHCDPCGVSSVMTGDELKCPRCGESYGTFSELFGYSPRTKKRFR